MIGQLEHELSFAPEESLEEFLARIPAAWAVCLLSDARQRPVQLLCVKNLRASLKRRLGFEPGEDASVSSRRIDLRGVVRQVGWTRVDSSFEQDVVYLEIARQAFPDQYTGVLGFRPAWWIHVQPEVDRPRFARTIEPGQTPGRCFGPIPDGSTAERLVRTVEDLFDLCRDPAALTAAPAGPCQWKQMGKCVGPCDGTVSLPAYRALVDHAAEVIADVPRALEGHELRMRHAAAALHFETAGRIKAFIEKLSALRDGPFRYLRPIEQFRFLAVMPGRARHTAKLLAITPGRVDPLLCLCQKPSSEACDEVLRLGLAALAEPAMPIDTAVQREWLSLVTDHLFPSRRTPGVFIPIEDIDEGSVTAALVEVNGKRVSAEPALEEDEGEVRGLQAF